MLDGIVDAAVRAGANHMLLPALSSQDVAEMVRQQLGATPGHRLLHSVAGAAGNPLFVSDMVAALPEDGAIANDGMADVATSPFLRRCG